MGHYEVGLAKTFFDALDKRIPRDRHDLVYKTLEELALRPSPPGLRVHRVDHAQSEWWSARVDDFYRLIFYEWENKRIAVWVDSHDEAYEWARRRKMEIDRYGAIRYLLTNIPPPPQPISTKLPEVASPAEKYPLKEFADEDLVALGVPELEWARYLRTLDKGTLEDKLLELCEQEILDEDTMDRLCQLADGVPLRKLLPPVQLRMEIDPLLNQSNRSRYWTARDWEELRRFLSQPWDEWLIFLNPTQREATEKCFSGPARVTGGAGTGKTVVAIHRTDGLRRRYVEEPIFLTTFNKSLANELKRRMEMLIRELPHNLRIQHLDEFVVQEARRFFPGIRVSYEADEIKQKVGFDALCATHGSGFSAEFVWQEWERVIDAWNIRSVEEYLRFERIGRGVPLNPRQREQLWSLFAAMRQRLLNAGIMTPNLACYELANRFQKKPPFRCVIADEAQDFGPAQMRLLQSLAPADQPDNLFFCVDVAQRIYARSVPWVHYNIDVRGRSMRLRINYRNTLQIQRAAERVLPPERQAELARAWDEQEDIQTGLRPVPCLRGLDPELVACESYEEERRRLTNWLQRCHADGIPYNQIAILARSKELLSELVEPALRKLGLTSCPLGQGIVALDYQVYVGTAHASKGLEFRAVAIVGASDNMFPSQSAIISCADHHELQEVLQRERNLLYTAMMRPRERLYISWTGRRSRFLPAKV